MNRYLIQIIYTYMASNIPIKYELFLNRSIWLIDRTLTGTTILGQSGPGSNDIEVGTQHSLNLQN